MCACLVGMKMTYAQAVASQQKIDRIADYPIKTIDVSSDSSPSSFVSEILSQQHELGAPSTKCERIPKLI